MVCNGMLDFRPNMRENGLNTVVLLTLVLMANVIAPIHFVHFSWANPLVTAHSSCFMVLN